MLDLLLKGAVVVIESFSMKIQHIFKIIGDKISVFHAKLDLLNSSFKIYLLYTFKALK